VGDQKLQIDQESLGRSASLRDVAAALFRHRRLVLFSFLGIFLGAVLAALVLPKQYQSEMKILVKRGRVEASLGVQPQPAISEEELNSEVELLKGHDLLEKVVVACGLDHAREGHLWDSWTGTAKAASAPPEGEEPRVSRAVNRLESQLQIAPIKKTSLIRVSYASSDPERSAKVLATLANLYLEKHVAVYRAPGAFDFFQRETERYRTELTAAEKRVEEFDRSEGVVAPQLERQIVVQKLADFDATLRSTQVAIAETEQRMRKLELQLATTPARETTQIRTSDNPMLLQHLKSTLLELELKRTSLLEKFAPDYRPLKEIEKQIAQAKTALQAAENAPLRDQTTDREPTHQWMKEELAKAKAELAALQARAVATARVLQLYAGKARAIDEKETAQEDLLREAKAAEDNYLLYRHREEEARISDALDKQRIVNVALAEEPTVPALPSRPRPLWTVLVGTLLAGVVSVGLAFVSDYLDPSFRTPEEVRRALDLPVLAAVPKNGG